MANSYYQVYIQTVFAVKFRDSVLQNDWRPKLLAVIGNLINKTGCKTMLVNGVDDHIHCLIGFKPDVSISELTKTVKAHSSKFINDNKLTSTRFEWQEGYGAFSYSRSQIDEVFKYISNQEEHHKKQTFRAEFIKFLEKFDVPFDEKYIFKELE